MSYTPYVYGPANGAVADVENDGVTFSWKHNGIFYLSQTGFWFRRTFPNGTHDWWTGSGWSGAEQMVTTAAEWLTVPPGLWDNGYSMRWAVQTEDVWGHGGDLNGRPGGYSDDRWLYSSTPPTVTVTDPPETSAVPRPTLKWTYHDDEGEVQYGWIAQVVAESTYSAPGYDPESHSGHKWSYAGDNTAVAATIDTNLENHTRYRAYVKVASSPNPPGGLQYSAYEYKEFYENIPPYAPTISYPINGSVVDLEAGFTLQWENNFFASEPLQIERQSAFAIRRVVVGVGTYEWWNGTTWQDSVIYLASSGTVPSYAFRSGDISNGDNETFCVSMKDSFGTASLYSPGVTVLGSSAAQVTVYDPPSVTATTQPTVSWSMYDVDGDSQQTYQVRIVPSGVYLDVGFNAITSTAVWETDGEVASATTRSVKVPIDLLNANRYRAYVRVTTNSLYSEWSYAEFTVSLVPPAVPAVVTTVLDDEATISISIQCRDSVLSSNASMGADGWSALSNCTATASGGASSSGYINCLSSTASGTMSAITTEMYTIAPNVRFIAAASFAVTGGATARNTCVSIEFLDDAEDVVSTVDGDALSDATLVRPFVSAVAPGDAVKARMKVSVIDVDAAARIHTFSDPVLRPGTGIEWTPGGLLGDTFVTVSEYLDSRGIRRGSDIPVPVDSQQIVVRDEEVPIGRSQDYRVLVRAVYPNTVLSLTTPATTPIVWTSGWLWLSDPTRLHTAHLFAPQKLGPITRPLPQGKFRVLGRSDSILTTGVRGLREGNFVLLTHDRAERNAYLDLITTSDVLLLRIPPDRGETEGETIYVRFEGDAPEERPLDSRTPHRAITQSWIEQRMPDTGLSYTAVI